MKYLLLIFLLCCQTTLLYAQASSQDKKLLASLFVKEQNQFPREPEERKGLFKISSLVSFGLKAGLNYSNFNFNKGTPRPAELIPASWKPGYVVGFFFQIPLHHQLLLQQEYLYSQVAGENKSWDKVYKLNYLSLPVLLRYEPSPRWSFMAGPQFDILIWSREFAGGGSGMSADTEERSIGITGGVEFEVFSNVSLGARFMHGINDVDIRHQSNAEEFKMEQLQVTASIVF